MTLAIADYRAMQRRLAWDVKAAVDRRVENACRRNFQRLWDVLDHNRGLRMMDLPLPVPADGAWAERRP